MCRLADDIISLLEGNGIVCSRRTAGGFEAILAKTPERESYRVILPLEITTESPEEAGIISREAKDVIAFMERHEGYPLIITEDRWKSKRPMMEARLLAHLEVFTSVFARNCTVCKLDKAEAQNFLEANHSYGYAACRYHYGLRLKSTNELIAAATFSNARKWDKGGREIRSYEWTRYASLPGMRISGGMGKLLKAFINEVRPDDIMSYADLEWSDGSVYNTLGFSREDDKEAVCFTIDPSTWERTAAGKFGRTEPPPEGILHFRNFGSAKYRMKLTDYE